MSASFFHDARFAVRSLSRTPAAFLLALFTLSLGIGVNVAIFSVVNAVLLRPLPYHEPGQLLWLRQQAAERSSESLGLAPLNAEAWNRDSRGFSGLGAYRDWLYHLSTADGQPERVSGAQVTPELLRVLGVEPVIGRAFTSAEGEAGGGEAALLGHDLWQRRFGADPAVLGREVRLDGRRHIVVGVMGPDFRFPEYAEAWTPLRLGSSGSAWGRGELSLIGRLAPGWTLETAQADLEAVTRRLEAEHPEENARLRPLARPLRRYYVGDTGTAALVFLGLTCGLLLLVCANLGNFLLARAMGRHREIAIRGSLGAGPRRLVRQLLTEGFVIAAAGGVGGLVAGALILRLLVHSIPISLPFWAVFEIDWRVVAFALVLALLSGIFFGLAPAVHAARLDLNRVLKEGQTREGRRRRLGMTLLVAGEMAMAAMFVLVAGSVAASFLELQRNDLGFTPPQALTFAVDLNGANPGGAAGVRRLHDDLLEAVAAVPGVTTAASTASLPLQGGSYREVATDGAARQEGWPVALVRVVSPSYLRLLGVPLFAGRPMDELEDEVVVSRALAQRLWPADQAVGRRLRLVSGVGRESDRWFRVGGVVGDLVQDPTHGTVTPEVYLPFAAEPTSIFFVVAATAGPPASFADEVRGRAWATAPGAVIDRLATFDELLGKALWQPRLYSWLLALFAGFGLALATLGLYGLISYAVGTRSRELALRVALGAGRGHVLSLVYSQATRLVGAGLLLGIGGALLLSRLLRGFMGWFEGPTGVSLVAFVGLLVAVTVLASYGPTRRALRLDPSSLTRAE